MSALRQQSLLRTSARRKVVVLAVVVVVVVAGVWGAGLQTRLIVSRWVTVRVVELPPPPKRVSGRLLGGRPVFWGAVGIDPADNILVEVEDAVGYSALVRFDPRGKRWLKGGVGLNPYGPVLSSQVLPAGDAVWILNSRWVLRAVFSDRWTSGERVLHAGYWKTINTGTAGETGRAVIAGSGGCRYSQSRESRKCKYSVIWLPGARAARLARIRASPQGEETDVATGPSGSVWLVVPHLRQCHQAGCDESGILRYDVKSRRLTRFLIPAKMWPEATHGTTGRLAYLYVRANGTVWLVCLADGDAVRVITLDRGSFRSRVLHLPGPAVPDVRPLMDARGNLWFNGYSGQTYSFAVYGTEYVVSPTTGTTSTLSDLHGIVLEDLHGNLWYVKSPAAA